MLVGQVVMKADQDVRDDGRGSLEDAIDYVITSNIFGQELTGNIQEKADETKHPDDPVDLRLV